eukprot:INCI246.1.p1 GENE.INCI246.1~~INCI246.1.p1  ORF type:complete len:1334 (-),score=226.47 INCI246.1:1235-5236(-)
MLAVATTAPHQLATAALSDFQSLESEVDSAGTRRTTTPAATNNTHNSQQEEEEEEGEEAPPTEVEGFDQDGGVSDADVSLEDVGATDGQQKPKRGAGDDGIDNDRSGQGDLSEESLLEDLQSALDIVGVDLSASEVLTEFTERFGSSDIAMQRLKEFCGMERADRAEGGSEEIGSDNDELGAHADPLDGSAGVASSLMNASWDAALGSPILAQGSPAFTAEQLSGRHNRTLREQASNLAARADLDAQRAPSLQSNTQTHSATRSRHHRHHRHHHRAHRRRRSASQVSAHGSRSPSRSRNCSRDRSRSGSRDRELELGLPADLVVGDVLSSDARPEQLMEAKSKVFSYQSRMKSLWEISSTLHGENRELRETLSDHERELLDARVMQSRWGVQTRLLREQLAELERRTAEYEARLEQERQEREAAQLEVLRLRRLASRSRDESENDADVPRQSPRGSGQDASDNESNATASADDDLSPRSTTASGRHRLTRKKSSSQNSEVIRIHAQHARAMQSLASKAMMLEEKVKKAEQEAFYYHTKHMEMSAQLAESREVATALQETVQSLQSEVLASGTTTPRHRRRGSNLQPLSFGHHFDITGGTPASASSIGTAGNTPSLALSLGALGVGGSMMGTPASRAGDEASTFRMAAETSLEHSAASFTPANPLRNKAQSEAQHRVQQFAKLHSSIRKVVSKWQRRAGSRSATPPRSRGGRVVRSPAKYPNSHDLPANQDLIAGELEPRGDRGPAHEEDGSLSFSIHTTLEGNRSETQPNPVKQEDGGPSDESPRANANAAALTHAAVLHNESSNGNVDERGSTSLPLTVSATIPGPNVGDATARGTSSYSGEVKPTAPSLSQAMQGEASNKSQAAVSRKRNHSFSGAVERCGAHRDFLRRNFSSERSLGGTDSASRRRSASSVSSSESHSHFPWVADSTHVRRHKRGESLPGLPPHSGRHGELGPLGQELGSHKASTKDFSLLGPGLRTSAPSKLDATVLAQQQTGAEFPTTVQQVMRFLTHLNNNNESRIQTHRRNMGQVVASTKQDPVSGRTVTFPATSSRGTSQGGGGSAHVDSSAHADSGTDVDSSPHCHIDRSAAASPASRGRKGTDVSAAAPSACSTPAVTAGPHSKSNKPQINGKLDLATAGADIAASGVACPMGGSAAPFVGMEVPLAQQAATPIADDYASMADFEFGVSESLADVSMNSEDQQLPDFDESFQNTSRLGHSAKRLDAQRQPFQSPVAAPLDNTGKDDVDLDQQARISPRVAHGQTREEAAAAQIAPSATSEVSHAITDAVVAHESQAGARRKASSNSVKVAARRKKADSKKVACVDTACQCLIS